MSYDATKHASIAVNVAFRDDTARRVTLLWDYFRQALPRMVETLDPQLASLHGTGRGGNYYESLKGSTFPVDFGPLTWIRAIDHPPELMAAVRALPDCAVSEVGNGLLVRPVETVWDTPTKAFKQAVEALPTTPRAKYVHQKFPRLPG